MILLTRIAHSLFLRGGRNETDWPFDEGTQAY
jgi:hypothetical protein